MDYLLWKIVYSDGTVVIETDSDTRGWKDLDHGRIAEVHAVYGDGTPHTIVVIPEGAQPWWARRRQTVVYGDGNGSFLRTIVEIGWKSDTQGALAQIPDDGPTYLALSRLDEI